MTEYSDFDLTVEKFLEGHLFVDEVIRKGLVLPKGTVITRGYRVVLPEGVEQKDLKRRDAACEQAPLSTGRNE